MFRNLVCLSIPRALLALASLMLLLNAGCTTVRFCNGTSEEVIFSTTEYPNAPRGGIDRNHRIGPCECLAHQYFLSSDKILHGVYDSNAVLLFAPRGSNDFDKSEYVVFDGFKTYFSNTAPDMSAKSTLVLRNQSTEAVFIKPDSTEIKMPPSTLILPASHRDFTTIAQGRGEFSVYDETGTKLDGPCEIGLADGNEIIWDGVELRCVENPGGGDAAIDICNIDQQTNAPSVIFVLQGGDPLVDGVFVIPDQCEVLQAPMGAPATIEVWDNEGVAILDWCTINDPTTGDSATWDGVEVTCEDL